MEIIIFVFSFLILMYLILWLRKGKLGLFSIIICLFLGISSANFFANKFESDNRKDTRVEEFKKPNDSNTDIHFKNQNTFKNNNRNSNNIFNNSNSRINTDQNTFKYNNQNSNNIYNNSNSRINTDIKIRVGAICNDGWVSSSTGRGTCSGHGGVSYWLYE